MSKRKITMQTAADLDPIALAQLKALERQRKRASRVLLKRRQRKAGQ